MKTDLKTQIVPRVQARIGEQRDAILHFLRDICAIPSVMGRIGEVGKRIMEEMRRLGFEEVRFDRMGNVLGQMGQGRESFCTTRILIRWTLGTDRRGAGTHSKARSRTESCTPAVPGMKKQSTPGMLYGIALAKELGLLEGFTVYYFGNMEEDCDGLACQALVEREGLRPDLVVVGEPTEMNVYRGHKGQVELKVTPRDARFMSASTSWATMPSTRCCRSSPASSNSTTASIPTPFWGRAASRSANRMPSTPSINAVP